MRLAAWFVFIIIAANIITPVHAQSPDSSLSPDDSLRVYAVYVVHTRPFKEPFTGYGIYLGQGAVITAAHVLGRWPFFISNPRVLIAGQELPAKVIRAGSSGTTDLAILSVDETRLPVSLRLRRNLLCKEPPQAGENVMVVVPGRTARSQIIFPQFVSPEYRTNFNSFINDDLWIAGGSGSGVFHAERKCLLGILSSKIWEDNYLMANGRVVRDLARSAIGFRHFIPASTIAEFIPAEFRF